MGLHGRRRMPGKKMLQACDLKRVFVILSNLRINKPAVAEMRCLDAQHRGGGRSL